MKKWMLEAIAAPLAWPAATPAQESRSTWWFVITEELHPPMVAEYEARTKDRADYEEDGKTVQRTLGDEGDALWKKTMGMMRDFRHVDAWMRPELSAVPSGS